MVVSWTSVRHRGILESLQRGVGSALVTPALRSHDLRAVAWVAGRGVWFFSGCHVGGGSRFEICGGSRVEKIKN